MHGSHRMPGRDLVLWFGHLGLDSVGPARAFGKMVHQSDLHSPVRLGHLLGYFSAKNGVSKKRRFSESV